MADKPKRPRDANQLAHMISGIATGEVDDTVPKKADAQRKIILDLEEEIELTSQK